MVCVTTMDRTTADDATFTARIEAFEQAADAPESWNATVERMARAIFNADPDSGGDWDQVTNPNVRSIYAGMATAALRVVTEPADGGAK